MLLFLFRAKVQRNRSRVKERLCETRVAAVCGRLKLGLRPRQSLQL